MKVLETIKQHLEGGEECQKGKILRQVSVNDKSERILAENN